MFAMTWRPSATTPGSCEKRPSSSTSRATAFVAAEPESHGDADVGLLDRERVVDAVARHRHRVPATLQGGERWSFFCCGRDPAEHDVRLEHLAELVEVGGQLARVESWTGRRRPPRRAIAATVWGLSPEMKCARPTPCSAKYSSVSRGVRAHALAERQQGDRRARSRRQRAPRRAPSGLWASTSVRRPVAASSAAARARPRAPEPSTPRRPSRARRAPTCPRPRSPTALHLRADENAMRASGSSTRCTGKPAPSEAACGGVRFGLGAVPGEHDAVQPSGGAAERLRVVEHDRRPR